MGRDRPCQQRESTTGIFILVDIRSGPFGGLIDPWPSWYPGKIPARNLRVFSEHAIDQ